MEHDRLFKELLRTFFAESIALFFPAVEKHLDKSSIEFLDKEVFTDLTSGQRHEVDLLVKARFTGRQTFPDSYREPGFEPEGILPRFAHVSLFLARGCARNSRAAGLSDRAAVVRQPASSRAGSISGRFPGFERIGFRVSRRPTPAV